jgi:5-formyltetrahydrofolate cyclo-ligase
MATKLQLRKQYQKCRDAIPEAMRAQKSKQITGHLQKTDWYAHTRKLLVYAAIKSEVDLSIFCENAWADGKELFFPKVDGQTMDFYRVTDWKQLSTGSFSVMEPDPLVCARWDARSADTTVICVPGIAFSCEGYRIGYGGGYYDRYLKQHDALYAVGICYEEQLADHLERELHDIEMQEIITENRRIITQICLE